MEQGNMSVELLADYVNRSRFCLRRRFVYLVDSDTCYYYKRIPLHKDETVSVISYGYIFPFLVAGMFVSNILIMLVLSKKHMRSSTNLLLLYMAVADLFVGIVPFPFTFYYFTLGHWREPRKHLHEWTCHMYHYLMNALPPICHNIAMWLTVIIAAQRFIYINYPLRSTHICTIRNVKIASAITCLVSVVCGLPKIFEYELSMIDGRTLIQVPRSSLRRRFNGTRWNLTDEFYVSHQRSCVFRYTAIMDVVGINRFYNIYFWTRCLVFITVPSILLIILNGLLLRGIHMAAQRKKRLIAENRGREARRQKESNSTSVMLVIIVTVFLVVNLPQGIFIAVLCVDTTFQLNIMTGMNKAYTHLFLISNNLMIIAVYPLNFAIYCSMSSAFRDTFKRLFCRNLPPIRQRASSLVGLSLRRFESFTSRKSISRNIDQAVKINNGSSLVRLSSPTSEPSCLVGNAINPPARFKNSANSSAVTLDRTLGWMMDLQRGYFLISSNGMSPKTTVIYLKSESSSGPGPGGATKNGAVVSLSASPAGGRASETTTATTTATFVSRRRTQSHSVEPVAGDPQGETLLDAEDPDLDNQNCPINNPIHEDNQAGDNGKGRREKSCYYAYEHSILADEDELLDDEDDGDEEAIVENDEEAIVGEEDDNDGHLHKLLPPPDYEDEQNEDEDDQYVDQIVDSGGLVLIVNNTDNSIILPDHHRHQQLNSHGKKPSPVRFRSLKIGSSLRKGVKIVHNSSTSDVVVEQQTMFSPDTMTAILDSNVGTHV